MEVHPIRTDQDHRAALAEIEACWGAPEGTEAGDRLDLLVSLVEAYEARRWPLDEDTDLDPVDALHFAIDELGHSQTELDALLGPRSSASDVLARRRGLTVAMIRRISDAWKIPAELLVKPYRLNRMARTG